VQLKKPELADEAQIWSVTDEEHFDLYRHFSFGRRGLERRVSDVRRRRAVKRFEVESGSF
jgi:hypothetical protein